MGFESSWPLSPWEKSTTFPANACIWITQWQFTKSGKPGSLQHSRIKPTCTLHIPHYRKSSFVLNPGCHSDEYKQLSFVHYIQGFVELYLKILTEWQAFQQLFIHVLWQWLYPPCHCCRAKLFTTECDVDLVFVLRSLNTVSVSAAYASLIKSPSVKGFLCSAKRW